MSAKIDFTTLLDILHPVGSYYETSDTSFNPNTAWGGTWLQDSSGRVTVGLDGNDADFNTVGKTGGSKTYTLTLGNMPKYVVQEVDTQQTSCKYSATGNAGQYRKNSPTPVEIVQPYVTVVRWHRTA